jgi:hypothetical protein
LLNINILTDNWYYRNIMKIERARQWSGESVGGARGFGEAGGDWQEEGDRP